MSTVNKSNGLRGRNWSQEEINDLFPELLKLHAILDSWIDVRNKYADMSQLYMKDIVTRSVEIEDKITSLHNADRWHALESV